LSSWKFFVYLISSLLYLSQLFWDTVSLFEIWTYFKSWPQILRNKFNGFSIGEKICWINSENFYHINTNQNSSNRSLYPLIFEKLEWETFKSQDLLSLMRQKWRWRENLGWTENPFWEKVLRGKENFNNKIYDLAIFYKRDLRELWRVFWTADLRTESNRFDRVFSLQGKCSQFWY